MVQFLTPNPERLKPFFQDKTFVSWAGDFLHELCDRAAQKDFRWVSLVNHAADVIGTSLFDLNWSDLWSYNYRAQGNMELAGNPCLLPFVQPLYKIYQAGPIPVSKRRKRRRGKNRGMNFPERMDDKFRFWANTYLQRFWREVVVHRACYAHINASLWNEVRQAAVAAGQTFKFAQLESFGKLRLDEFVIENSLVFFQLAKALFHVYTGGILLPQSTSQSVRRHHATHKGSKIIVGEPQNGNRKVIKINAQRVEAAPKSDLETAPEEVIDVTLYPVELQSRIGTDRFERQVIALLTQCLKGNVSSVSSKFISGALGVDQRDFEAWADNHPKLQWHRGLARENLVFYSLKPVLFPKVEDDGSDSQCLHRESCQKGSAAEANRRLIYGDGASKCERCEDFATHFIPCGHGSIRLCCKHHNDLVKNREEVEPMQLPGCEYPTYCQVNGFHPRWKTPVAHILSSWEAAAEGEKNLIPCSTSGYTHCTFPATHVTNHGFYCCRHHNELKGTQEMSTVADDGDNTDTTPDPKNPLAEQQAGEGLVELTTEGDTKVMTPPAIGTAEFDTLFTQFLTQGKLWRTVGAIAQGLGADKDELEKWAMDNPAVMRRVGKPEKGKEEKKVYYGLQSRMIEKEEKKPDPKPETKTETAPIATVAGPGAGTKKPSVDTPSITMQEAFSFAMLHSTADQFIRTMDFYANRLATRHEEAFSYFTKAQKALSTGVALLQKELKITDDKLPNLDQL
jgi:hypothetical protein